MVDRRKVVFDRPLLPKAPGSYLLCLLLEHDTRLLAGRLACQFQAGHYLYIGSALGPGGLRARLGRHISGAGKKHWHIDYLREYCRYQGACWTRASKSMESAWVPAIQALPGAMVPCEGFGASDSPLSSHLFFFNNMPAFAEIKDCLQRVTSSNVEYQKLAEME